MNYLKVIFASVLFTFLLNVSFGQLRHRIVLSLDISNNTLIDDPEITEVYKGDMVIWTIKRNENIEWFQITGARAHPFTRIQTNSDRTSSWGIVRNDASGDWKYKITYKRKTDAFTRQFDPKIAVMPGPKALFRVPLLLMAFGVPAILAFVFFNRWRNLKARVATLPEANRKNDQQIR